jgi:hypothetical protein
MYKIRKFQNFLNEMILVYQALYMQNTVHWLSQDSEHLNKIHLFFMNDRLSSQE